MKILGGKRIIDEFDGPLTNCEFFKLIRLSVCAKSRPTSARSQLEGERGVGRNVAASDVGDTTPTRASPRLSAKPRKMPGAHIHQHTPRGRPRPPHQQAAGHLQPGGRRGARRGSRASGRRRLAVERQVLQPRRSPAVTSFLAARRSAPAARSCFSLCTRRSISNHHNPALAEWGEFLHRPGEIFTDFEAICEEVEFETNREVGGNKGVSDETDTT